ncbi:MAG: universal stress protein [Haloarculaceae archaeon]
MYDDILVPTDGSEGTAETLRHALHIAEDNDATIHALFVVDKRIYLAADEDERESLAEELTETGEAALAEVSDAAETAGVPVRTELRRGVPYRDILTYAEDADVDLVVMGTHARTAKDRITHLGSTTERVVKNSERPVLTVRMPVAED